MTYAYVIAYVIGYVIQDLHGICHQICHGEINFYRCVFNIQSKSFKFLFLKISRGVIRVTDPVPVWDGHGHA